MLLVFQISNAKVANPTNSINTPNAPIQFHITSSNKA